ncbi:cadmium-translocating P-type ATPase, partial [bacterium]|nr:cadmium-translocating P-type ATPase [bacterium]
KNDAQLEDVPLKDILVGDTLVVYPHEVCPVDGEVIEGQGSMDESYLTGEPFGMTKTVGSTVISGAINGEAALTIRATHRSVDSRYEKITRVMEESEQKRPQLRRLADQLGALYTPLAVSAAVLAWALSGDSTRFLAVLVVATPCPLLIGIPVAIIGAISLSAKHAIIVKDPTVLEQVTQCRTAIFDKTGTLTYGRPSLTSVSVSNSFESNEVLGLVAGLERYSKHPLASAILKAAKEEFLAMLEASEVHEAPGKGLKGVVAGRSVQVTSRTKLMKEGFQQMALLPEQQSGLECVVLIDEQYAATFRFHDAPRAESKSLIAHLGPRHSFDTTMIISGDREPEVRYLAEQVGIDKVYAQQTPEDKLAMVLEENSQAKVLYVGDGINDAPAMMAATVGIAIGQNSDVTSQAAGVVIMDNSLKRVDEFIHISKHMKSIAMQSAIGGMVLSLGGMAFAGMGYLSPVNSAIFQELIDVFAILNALRASVSPKEISDF